LYWPEACAADEEHRELAGVPEHVMFATKPQLAGALRSPVVLVGLATPPSVPGPPSPQTVERLRRGNTVITTNFSGRITGPCRAVDRNVPGTLWA
jgi:hypothetical protein